MISESLLASLAGVLLSLAFAYIKPFRGWFDNLDGSYKRLIMLGGGLLSALVIFGLSCVNFKLFGVSVSCDIPGVLAVVEAFLAFMVSNQAVYTMLPKPQTYASYTYSGNYTDNLIWHPSVDDDNLPVGGVEVDEA